MRILFWGTYDDGKPRARILVEGSKRAGAQTAQIHSPIWRGIEDKSQLNRLSTLWRLLRWVASYPGLIYRFLRAPTTDLVVVSYPGILDVLVLAPFARARGIPLVWDMFMSLYDTIVLDRRKLHPKSLLARTIYHIERRALRLAQFTFLDTKAHARRVERLFDLQPNSCGAVWVGAEDLFSSESAVHAAIREHDQAILRVLFYGQFIPLQGIETIVQAARLLNAEPVEWTVIGRGQTMGVIRELLHDKPLSRLKWIDWVTYEQLLTHIREADVCLGIFGSSDKAASVIPNKAFQVLAAGKPLITRDSEAIREILVHAPPCAYLVAPSDPNALADAIRTHMRYDRSAASDCHGSIRNAIQVGAVGREFIRMLRKRVLLEGESP